MKWDKTNSVIQINYIQCKWYAMKKCPAPTARIWCDRKFRVTCVDEVLAEVESGFPLKLPSCRGKASVCTKGVITLALFNDFQ